MVRFKERINIIIYQGVGVAGIMVIHFEGVSIVPVQSVLGPEPHKPPAVLPYTINAILGKAVANGDIFKTFIPVC
jgi:hypothetical protein